MRIVGGEWRGRAIEAPPDGARREKRNGKRAAAPDSSLRPTTDRARETLFNVLAHDPDTRLRDATVLDCFAGTGALGIEALSRGAAACIFVERDRAARALIERTLDRLGGADRARVLPLDATRPGPAPLAHDLVLLDPPYGRGLGERALAALAANGWLADDATVVIEEEADAAIAWPSGFEPVREIGVGTTRFHVARSVARPVGTGGSGAERLRPPPPNP